MMLLQINITLTQIYISSAVVVLVFALIICYQTLGKNSTIYFFTESDEELIFDWDFLKKIFVQLVAIFFTAFTFMNVLYFVYVGEWVSKESFQTSRGFVVIGAVMYVFDTIKSTMEILTKRKKNNKHVLITKEKIKATKKKLNLKEKDSKDL